MRLSVPTALLLLVLCLSAGAAGAQEKKDYSFDDAWNEDLENKGTNQPDPPGADLVGTLGIVNLS